MMQREINAGQSSNPPLPPQGSGGNFLVRLGPNDILIGRGAPSNSNEGNRRFRDLVQSRKPEYMCTSKRHKKDRIAREIVNTIINERFGRFVRKIESLIEAEEMGVPEGITAWCVVPLDTAIQKTKQALRDREAGPGTKETPGSPIADRRLSTASLTGEAAGQEAVALAEPSAERLATIGTAKAAGPPPPPPPPPTSSADPNNTVSDYLRALRAGRSSAAAAAEMEAENISAKKRAAATQIPPAQQPPPPPPPPPPPFPQMWQQGPYLTQAVGAARGGTSSAGAAASSSASGGVGGGQQRQQYSMYPQSHILNPLPQPSTLPPSMAAATGAGPGAPSASPSSASSDTLSALLSGRSILPPSTATTGTTANLSLPLSRQYTATSTSATADNLSNVMDLVSTQRLERNPPSALSFSMALDPMSALYQQQRLVPVGIGVAGAGAGSAAGMLSSADESAGEMALRMAHERVEGARVRDPREAYLDLSLIELFLLNAMCSHGLPVWSDDGKMNATPPASKAGSHATTTTTASSEGEDKQERFLTWRGFAHVLAQVAEAWSDRERSKTSLSSVSDESMRLTRVTRSAVVEANVLELDPEELARKATMLLETVGEFARGARSGSHASRATLKKPNFEFWLEEEMCRWAGTLDIVGDNGRPVPYSSQKFLSDPGQSHHKGSDLICTMGSLDRESCQDIFSQVACLTRLRSVAEKCEQQGPPVSESCPGSSGLLRTKLIKALSDFEEGSKVWRHRPSWWGNLDPVAYDLLLVRKIMKEGFQSVVVTEFSDKSLKHKLKSPPSSLPKKSESTVTLQRLGLSKAGVHERIDQLVELLHIQQSNDDMRDVMEERRKRVLSDLGVTVKAGSSSLPGSSPPFASTPEEVGDMSEMSSAKKRRTSLPM